MVQTKDEENLNKARRRVASVANHLMPMHLVSPIHTTPIGLSSCSSSMKDSYHRVHGEVPTHEPQWENARDESGKEYTDIIYEKAVGEPIAKITINRPERRNAFRPQTIKELIRAFNDARDDGSVGVIILTGKVHNANLSKLCEISFPEYINR